MKVKAILFGSTGMIGQGVLKECLEDDNVESLLLINRHALSLNSSKVKEIIHNDFTDFSSLEKEFANYNTCFYCLGISAVGLSESEYHRITYDFAVKTAEALLKTGKEFTFCYISGAGTDSTENGRMMWARVKGKLENKLLSMPFKKAYMFRPGYIQPLKGIKSKTKWYNAFYLIFKLLYFILKPFKGIVTDTSTLGKAMIRSATVGYGKNILESSDINKLGK